MGVHHDKKAFVDATLSARGKKLASRSAQDVTQRLRGRVVPILGGGLFARRRDPSDVFHPRFREHLPPQEPGPRENAMTAAEADQIAHESGKALVFGTEMFPVEPGELIIVAIGVIVTMLRAPDLVSPQ